MLQAEIALLEGVGRGGQRMPGYLPTCTASDPIYPIVRIPKDEGFVFNTRVINYFICNSLC